MAPTHMDVDESISGRRRKPSRSPELSSPRPIKRHEPHHFSGSSYDNGTLGMEDSRRAHGRSNRLPWMRQEESSRHSSGEMANAPEWKANRNQGIQHTQGHLDSKLEMRATMLADGDEDGGRRDCPTDNTNVTQPKRKAFPLNAPILPAADRNIAPSQNDLRMPHAVIEVRTAD